MKQLYLTKGLIALVDDEDYDNLAKFEWFAQSNPHGKMYASRNCKITRRTILMHRSILNAKESEIVDHINNNGLDNRKFNLRLSTFTLNKANSPKRNQKFGQKATSGFKGVVFRSQNNKFVAQIQCKGKKEHLGTFVTAEEAALAYDTRATQLFGLHAWLNFPIQSAQ